MSKLYLAGVLVMLAACGTKAPPPAQQQTLKSQAANTLAEMTARDPSLPTLLGQSAGYAVFPSVGAGGAVVGGAFGKGILYEQGMPTGYVEISQGSIGLQLGGQTYAQLVALETPADVAHLKSGNVTLGANANAVVLKTGAAAETHFQGGVAVVVMPRGGLMAGVTVTGQQIRYRPLTAMR
jgi:lipid-binding SYLF domain-containing protein